MGEGRGGRKGEPGKVGEEMEGDEMEEGWGEGGGRGEIDVDSSIIPSSSLVQQRATQPRSQPTPSNLGGGLGMRLQCTVM